MNAAIEVEGLDVHYGQLQALRGVALTVAYGETVAVIGANGAGKSTLLRTLSGLHRPTTGKVDVMGMGVTHVSVFALVRAGLALVPEGRRMLPSLSVRENLLIAADGFARSRRGSPQFSLTKIFALFPALAERAEHRATLLSGGEQQMLAIGRALMTSPRVLLCDELSLGLAPSIVRSLYDALATVRRNGMTLVLVEQNVQQSLSFADRVYCLKRGRVFLSGRPADLSHEQIRTAYFGA